MGISATVLVDRQGTESKNETIQIIKKKIPAKLTYTKIVKN